MTLIIADPLLADSELDEKLAASPAERVTVEYINSRIKDAEFTRIGKTATLCNIELDNGYSVRGESACVNPANYDREIGERIAYDNAFAKLWPLFGFLLAENGTLKK